MEGVILHSVGADPCKASLNQGGDAVDNLLNAEAPNFQVLARRAKSDEPHNEFKALESNFN